VFSLVERGGKARSFHVANVTAQTLRPIIVSAASADSHFRTDESGVYWSVGEEFKTHRTVVHAAEDMFEATLTRTPQRDTSQS
jgi:hypothetical protein